MFWMVLSRAVRDMHVAMVYPSASCCWDLVCDQGDEEFDSSSVSMPGRIKIFLNFRIRTMLFPLLHVYY